ncbi:type II secretion system F family protein [Janthinobacterium sp. SUN118]|uniref:type II secretion system F family protein n=1 Tax=unclassified Janthinobacterium TaxID=2610881 RepID=UPI00258B58A1|nr:MULTISPECIES: type II secretion system F family protein [unclassified Janthinobacterium]MCX7294055.1 type II secretion system F family protein [Janthinobacterium sp.]MDN2708763.1 type II secretion system F family protein [Janthinobacterium sp. SUN118]
MTTMQMGFLGLLFVAVFVGAMFVLLLAVPDPLRHRLDSVGAAGTGGASHWLTHFVKLSGPLARLSLPEEGWETSKIRLRFMNAGLRHPSAPLLYFGAKTALAVGLPMLLFLGLSIAGVHYSGTALLLWLLLAAGFGYYLPNGWLNRRIRLRQRDIFESFPDALDLMTVCVEAGLAMDAALARVASEITLKSAVLAEELHLLTLELRAGNSKERALRNLALRTGVEDVDALVAMLIQAERFGTSIAASLRVQSDQLRTKRRQLAEEQAAKIALKLLFPLIFFIFPSLLVVLMGPAFLQIYRVLLPGMAGGN